jgi:hypothetical protein
LKLPSKIKIFAWKYLPGALSVLATLADKHIPVSSQCPMCNICPEDIHHMLFMCQRAKLVWQWMGLLSIINLVILVDRSGSVIIEEVLRNLKDHTTADIHDLKELILIGAWYIWWQRREFVKGQSVAPPRKTTFSILALKSIFLAQKTELNQWRCSGVRQNLTRISLTLMLVIFLMAHVLRVQSSEMTKEWM